MFVTDLRSNTGNSGYQLPPQAIPTSKKNKMWKKENMDSLENIGVRYLQYFHSRFGEVERIVKGGFQYKDLTKSSAFLSELEYWREQASISSEMVHYPFIEPIINQLVMDYIKKPNPLIINAEDELSVNDFLETQTELLWQTTQATVEKRIKDKAVMQGFEIEKQDFESEEEYQQHQEQVNKYFDENTPQEIKDFMGTGYRPVYILWAEKTLKESEQRFNFEELYKDALYSYFLYGRCFIHHKVGFDYYQPELWSAKNTFTSVNADKKYVDLGDYAGNISYYSPNDVIVKWGSKLTQRQKQQVTRSLYYDSKGDYTATSTIENWVEKGGGRLQGVPHKDYYAYENARFVQENLGVDLGVTDWFGDSLVTTNFLAPDDLRNDLIRVTEAYWVSYQQVGYLTLLDEQTGALIQEILSDDIIGDYLKEKGIKSVRNVSLEEHTKDPKPNTVVWDYVEQVWTGIKIAKENTDLTEDLYIGVEPIEYQLKGESDTYGVRLPVTGIVSDQSLASKVTQYQIDYNVALNMAKDYASKELGQFFLMDMAYLPQDIKDLKGDERYSEMFTIVRELGILPIDSSNPQAQQSKFNQFTSVNMDLTAAIVGKVNYAMLIKRQAFEVIGLSPERLGMPSEQTTATGINLANNASFSQTELWYSDYGYFQNRTYEIHLNIAQYAKQNNKDNTIFYTDSDMVQNVLKITDPYLSLRKFRVYPQNNGSRKSSLETLKQYFMSDNTIPKDIDIIAQVITSDSFTQLKTLAKNKKKEADLMRQQEQNARMQEIELMKAAEAEKEAIKHQYKIEELRIKGEMELNKAAIVAIGFDEEKDRDKNNVADVLDQLQLVLQEAKQSTDAYLKEQQLNVTKSQNVTNTNLAEKKLLLDEKKIEVDKYKADKALEVARENKFSHEMKSKQVTNKK